LKVWRIRNNGRIQWPSQTKLEFISGDFLDFEVVDLPLAAPCETVNVQIRVLPAFSSFVIKKNIASYFRLSVNGVQFGHTFWIKALVDVTPREVSSHESRSVGDDSDALQYAHDNMEYSAAAPEITNSYPSKTFAEAMLSESPEATHVAESCIQDEYLSAGIINKEQFERLKEMGFDNMTVMEALLNNPDSFDDALNHILTRKH